MYASPSLVSKCDLNPKRSRIRLCSMSRCSAVGSALATLIWREGEFSGGTAYISNHCEAAQSRSPAIWSYRRLNASMVSIRMVPPTKTRPPGSPWKPPFRPAPGTGGFMEATSKVGRLLDADPACGDTVNGAKPSRQETRNANGALYIGDFSPAQFL